MNLPEDKTAAVTAEEAKDAASILVSWCPADRQGPFDVVMRYIEQTSRATRLATAPKGWKLTKHADGAIVVWKDGLGGYAATKDHDSIAVAVLWELANDMLDAAPAASSPEAADERAAVAAGQQQQALTIKQRPPARPVDYRDAWSGYTMAELQYHAAEAHELRRAVRDMATMLANLEWAEHVSGDSDIVALEVEITKLIDRINGAPAQAAPQAVLASAPAGAGEGALPRLRAFDALRKTGQWPDGVPEWARDHSGRMNDLTAAHAVIEELRAALAGEPAVAAADEGRPAREELLIALRDLASEFRRVYPIYYYAEPWAHNRNVVLKAADALVARAASQDEHQEQG